GQCLVVGEVALNARILPTSDQSQPECVRQPQELEELQADGEEECNCEQQRDEDKRSTKHITEEFGHLKELIHTGISLFAIKCRGVTVYLAEHGPTTGAGLTFCEATERLRQIDSGASQLSHVLS